MHHTNDGSSFKKHLKFLKELKRDLKRNPKHRIPKHPFAKYGYKYPTFGG
jgi:hypothetical protein